MARKHSLTELTAVNSAGENSSEEGGSADTPHAGSQGARRAIGAVSKSFEHLKSQGSMELDPSLIDPPLIRDRLEIKGPKLDSLIEQIGEHGQQIAILVRPHLEEEGRYQIAYGWRRREATLALGIKVKANVRGLTDKELVVAQGQENSEREDLTFIEKAQYAANLEAGGFDRETIMSCLATDKTTCSRLISTTKKIPMSIVEAIGPSPRTGRDRWVELAGLIASRKDFSEIEELMTSEKFVSKTSDERFNAVFAKASTKKQATTNLQQWTTEDGKKIAKFRAGATASTLIFDHKQAPEFGDFVLKSLPKLYAAYQRGEEK